ncbi:WhiB family transcriptional regulator [Streptomyces sp. H27-H1]|uniref:WhiB family transcriptional regulator n=1 Tax=Streptomyces sp. H27-H1 TaxID=2996461 RepID=UPI0022702519|nr:WhiB family transcriptional regulator [Streptomyces sp. H27-H1]MCY0931508.1 WhiB family transcriptional regulator [Streptomyces sp. H27-H1]
MRYITTHENPAIGMLGIADRSWTERGACYGMDIAEADEIFFPTVTNSKSTAAARAICGGCPVRQQCFDAAMDSGARVGFRAGLTAAERRKFHNTVAARLDYSRVEAIFRGRDVALSVHERNAVVRQALVRGWSVDRLAALLGSDLDYTRKMMALQVAEVTARDHQWLRQMSPAQKAGNPGETPSTSGPDSSPSEPRTAFEEAA